jgi:hypothetical protein
MRVTVVSAAALVMSRSDPSPLGGEVGWRRSINEIAGRNEAAHADGDRRRAANSAAAA